MTGDAMSDELKQGPPPPPPPPDAKPSAPPPPPDAKPPAPSPSQAPTPSPSVSVEMEPSGQAMQGWRYEYEGQLVGPFSEDAFKKEARSRRLTPSMMITHDDGRRVSAANVVKFRSSEYKAERQAAESGKTSGSKFELPDVSGYVWVIAFVLFLAFLRMIGCISENTRLPFIDRGKDRSSLREELPDAQATTELHGVSARPFDRSLAHLTRND